MIRKVIWLDDMRDPNSETWCEYLARWAPGEYEVVWAKDIDDFKKAVLEIRNSPEMKLHGVFFDNDLGEGIPGRDGKHAFNWLEQETHFNRWPRIPVLECQSSNPSAKKEILAGIQSLQRYWNHENDSRL